MLILEKDRFDWANQLLNKILNDAKVTDTSKQIINNSQKTNMDVSWRKAVKRETETTPKCQYFVKQPKMNRYQSSKLVPTNSFEALEKKLKDANNNIRIEKIANLYIFIARVNIFLSFSQLLKGSR